MDRQEYKERALRIMSEFGLPHRMNMDSDIQAVEERVTSEISMAEDLAKQLSDIHNIYMEGK